MQALLDAGVAPLLHGVVRNSPDASTRDFARRVQARPRYSWPACRSVGCTLANLCSCLPLLFNFTNRLSFTSSRMLFDFSRSAERITLGDVDSCSETWSFSSVLFDERFLRFCCGGPAI